METLEKIRGRAERGDVTFDLFRWFGSRMRDHDPELLAIQRQGFKSAAIAWLKSMTPEEMKYGTASRDQRLEKARQFAEQAGIDLSVLAEETGLGHVL